jgi:hypothetical protein
MGGLWSGGLDGSGQWIHGRMTKRRQVAAQAGWCVAPPIAKKALAKADN